MNGTSKPGAVRVLLAIGGLGAVLLAGCGDEDGVQPSKPGTAQQRAAPAQAETGAWVEVTRGSVIRTTTAIGSLQSARTTRLGPQVSGRVAEVLVDVGDQVSRGDVLVRLDDSFFQIEVAQAEAAVAAQKAEIVALERVVPTREAEVASAETVLADADLNLSRMRNLWEKPEGETPSIPKSRFDAAGFARKAAAAGLQAARSRLGESRARLESARVQLGESRAGLTYAKQRLVEAAIKAPYDAVVTRRHVDPGEPVTATPVTFMLEVQDTSRLELEFSLPQIHLSSVPVGTEVMFDIDGLLEHPIEARVTTVLPEIDKATRSLRCRVVVQNEDGALRPGLLARVRVVTARRDGVLVVPAAAVRSVGQRASVVVSVGDERESREVVTGLSADDSIEIVSGLTAGDRVLIDSRTSSVSGGGR